MSCGILVPHPGIEPGPLSEEVPSPDAWTTREVPLLVVLIYISLMISDVEHFFINSLIILYLLKLFIEINTQE